MNLYQELKKLTKPQCVEFAIVKAEEVIDLIGDEELKALSKNCIDCAKSWLENPTEENRNKCRAAADADAVYAAYAVADADADAVYAAYAAVYAAYAVADADAVYAADAAAAAAAADAAARAKSNKESLDLIQKVKAQEQDA